MGDDDTRTPATWIVTVHPPGDPTPAGVGRELVATQLWQCGALAVVEAHDCLRGVFSEQVELPAAWAGWDVLWEVQGPTDHMAAWRAASTPARAGRFVIVPSHLANDWSGGDPIGGGAIAPDRTHDAVPGGHVARWAGDVAEHVSADGSRPVQGRDGPRLHPIVMDAGMAFGSGHHETTAGCLAALGDRPVAGTRIADIGTGTGVLAIGAAMLGAAEVIGVDIDPTAVEVARRNAVLNEVDPVLQVGSVDVLQGRFDGIMANLLTNLLVELAEDLHAALQPGGWLIASGTSTTRAPRVVTALRAAGFVAVEVHPHGEWAVLTATSSPS